MTYITQLPKGLEQPLDGRHVIADIDNVDDVWLATAYVGMPFFDERSKAYNIVTVIGQNRGDLQYEPLGRTGQQGEQGIPGRTGDSFKVNEFTYGQAIP